MYCASVRCCVVAIIFLSLAFTFGGTAITKFAHTKLQPLQQRQQQQLDKEREYGEKHEVNAKKNGKKRNEDEGGKKRLNI